MSDETPAGVRVTTHLRIDDMRVYTYLLNPTQGDGPSYKVIVTGSCNTIALLELITMWERMHVCDGRVVPEILDLKMIEARDLEQGEQPKFWMQPN